MSLHFFFLVIDLYFLIAVVFTQIFSPLLELGVPIGYPTKEVKAEMKTHPVIVETAIGECLI